MLCQLTPEEKSHDISTLLFALVTLGIDCNNMRYTLCLLCLNELSLDSCKNLFNFKNKTNLYKKNSLDY